MKSRRKYLEIFPLSREGEKHTQLAISLFSPASHLKYCDGNTRAIATVGYGGSSGGRISWR
jgi:hypothetical protein